MGNHSARDVVILVGEVNDFQTVRSDLHRGQDHIELVGIQCRYQPVEILRDDLAGDFHRTAQCVGDIDVETLGFAIGALFGERRVVEVNTHAQGFCMGDRAGERQGQGGGNQQFLHVHLYFNGSVPDLCRLAGL